MAAESGSVLIALWTSCPLLHTIAGSNNQEKKKQKTKKHSRVDMRTTLFATNESDLYTVNV